MYKKVIVVALCVMIAVCFIGCGENTNAGGQTTNGSEPVEISIGHALSEGTPACEGIKSWAEAIEKETEGRVKLKVYPNSQLGSESEMIEQAKLGTIQGAAIMVGTMQAIDMKLAIEDLPYMWKDIEHARAAYDGEFGDYLADIVSQYGIKQVGYVEWGFRHLTNNTKPIIVPADMKGMSIRVAQTALRVAAFEQIGAVPTVMSFNELYSALQQGVIDAQENPLPTILAANFNEVQKYLSLSEHFYNTVMLYFNNDVWEKISPEDQETIMKLTAEMEKNVRKENDAVQDNTVNELQQKGMEVNDNVDKAAFREAMLPVYDKWEKEIFGQEMMDVYRKASGW